MSLRFGLGKNTCPFLIFFLVLETDGLTFTRQTVLHLAIKREPTMEREQKHIKTTNTHTHTHARSEIIQKEKMLYETEKKRRNILICRTYTEMAPKRQLL